MFVSDLLSKKHNTISFEVFPPKDVTNLSNIEKLAMLKPDFISVTYGAGGSNSNNTLAVSDVIQNKYNVITVPHLTCVSAKKHTVLNYIDELKKINIENIIALRGDVKDDLAFKEGDFLYASDLVDFLKENCNFSIGGGCYPETHFEASSVKEDLQSLKIKIAKGLDYIITQLFFDNDKIFKFTDELIKYDIDTPLLLGLFPPVDYKSFTFVCGIANPALPKALVDLIEKYKDKPEDLQKAGIAYTINQANLLKQKGYTRFHIYTMNRPNVAYEIINCI